MLVSLPPSGETAQSTCTEAGLYIAADRYLCSAQFSELRAGGVTKKKKC